MQKLTAVLTIVCLGAAIGCQRKAKPELAAVPPPVEPVRVQEYPSGPVQFVEPAGQPPQPVVTPVAPPPAQATYTIQKGDTLWKIAETHYGNGQRWQDIAAANPGVNPKKLIVGETLVLP